MNTKKELTYETIKKKYFTDHWEKEIPEFLEKLSQILYDQSSNSSLEEEDKIFIDKMRKKNLKELPIESLRLDPSL